jgi:hypothetical protein
MKYPYVAALCGVRRAAGSWDRHDRGSVAYGTYSVAWGEFRFANEAGASVME